MFNCARKRCGKSSAAGYSSGDWTEPELETELRPVLARFVKERNDGERFGDWCDRVFLNEQAKATN